MSVIRLEEIEQHSFADGYYGAKLLALQFCWLKQEGWNLFLMPDSFEKLIWDNLKVCGLLPQLKSSHKEFGRVILISNKPTKIA